MATAPTQAPVSTVVDPSDNAKQPRTFQCRNALWNGMEQLSRELECSVDYLVNEAMKQYLRQRPPSPGPQPQPPINPPPPLRHPPPLTANPPPVVATSPAVQLPTPPPGGRLVVVYNDQRYPVEKARFIIGRGKQSTDIMIQDGNVSRQHAMIECIDGRHYIVDLGSTNGVEFNRARVSRKLIASGDVFTICDHPLVCVYE